ncbi:MAG: hypothetical protein IKF82_00025 [Bacilli bacterium]|nr:hypothetical protein [Bacilli bacterium]
MVNEQIEIQNIKTVQEIDSRRQINEAIATQVEAQLSGLETISNQLDNIATAVTEPQSSTSDISLEDVHDKLDTLDNTIITTNTENILEMVNNQQEQINTIEEKLNLILEKLNEA